MIVLVTGATGLIGSHVVDLLVQRGEKVRAFVLPDEDAGRLVDQGVEISRGNMKDRDSLLAAVAGVEKIIHCAARTGPWGPKEEYKAINILGLQNLLDLSLIAGVKRFVHVSSIIVLGADVGGQADETSPTHIEPGNPYSWSKVLSERLVEKYIKEFNAPAIIIRPGWVYGPRDFGSFARFASLIHQGKMLVIGSGGNHVPLIYVKDVANGILLACENDRSIGETYILVNDELVTQSEYLEAIAIGLKVSAPKIHLPYRIALFIGNIAEMGFHFLHRNNPPPLTRYGVQLLGGENQLSIRKARQELGFSPQIYLSQGVSQSIAWLRQINKC